jgi:allose kinase
MEMIDAMGAGCATDINLLDPDAVILGGGVVTQSDFPRRKLEEAIKAHARKPYPAADLSFLWSKDAPENGVLGAGIFGFSLTS